MRVFYTSFSLFVFILIAIRCNPKLDGVVPMNRDELKNISSVDSLSINEYLRLVSSVKIVDSLFMEEDTAALIFRNGDIVMTNSPTVVISYFFQNRKFNSEEIRYLSSLTSSNQPALTTLKIQASYFEKGPSTIGSQAKYLINLANGKDFWFSNDSLLKE